MKHQIHRKFPPGANCFACQNGPKEGIGLRAYETVDGYAIGTVVTKNCHQGFPGLIHGGITATYFDEILWRAIEISAPHVVVMTIELTVTYCKPITVHGQELLIVAKTTSISGRHYEAEGKIILPDGQVAARCKGKYLSVNKGTFQEEEYKRECETYYEPADISFVEF
jgi:uncharacterized protein (TIGR00369 family)